MVVWPDYPTWPMSNAKVRSDFDSTAALRRAIIIQTRRIQVSNGADAGRLHQKIHRSPSRLPVRLLARDLKLGRKDLSHFQRMIDLKRSSSLSPVSPKSDRWGSSRTRAELEARGQFTIKIAFKWHGWWALSSASMEILRMARRMLDSRMRTLASPPLTVRTRYENGVMEHTGIRSTGIRIISEFSPGWQDV